MKRSSKPLAEGIRPAVRLKVIEVDIYAYDIPLRTPFRISLGEMKAANDVLVEVRTDAGIMGTGEACPFPPITGETQATSIAAALSVRDSLIGRDPLAVGGFLRTIGPLVRSNPSVIAAFEMALFDILGQAAGMPLFRLLGGDRSVLETDITTGLDTIEAMVASAKRHKAMGYGALKVKVGADPDEDLNRLMAIRKAVGDDVDIRIDANQGWTVPQAVRVLGKAEELDIQFVEQPVAARDVSGLSAVRARSPIPVMADESLFGPADALRLIQAEACDLFNIKLMKSGGILNAIRTAHIAEAANIRCMVGCMLDSRIALTAAAHFAASQDNVIFADLDGNMEHTVDPVLGGIEHEAGRLTLPEEPGLGCEVDPDFLRGLRKIR